MAGVGAGAVDVVVDEVVERDPRARRIDMGRLSGFASRALEARRQPAPGAAGRRQRRRRDRSRLFCHSECRLT